MMGISLGTAHISSQPTSIKTPAESKQKTMPLWVHRLLSYFALFLLTKGEANAITKVRECHLGLPKVHRPKWG